jgi:hypothetical protein
MAAAGGTLEHHKGHPSAVDTELNVPAEGLVLARVPEVDRLSLLVLRGHRNAVGPDDGAIEDDVRIAGSEAFAQYFGQFRRLGRQHGDGFMQVAVAGGNPDPVVTGCTVAASLNQRSTTQRGRTPRAPGVPGGSRGVPAAPAADEQRAGRVRAAHPRWQNM